MKSIHIHKDTYYIAFLYEGMSVFALTDNDQIDLSDDEEKACVLVNSYGIPFALSRRELLSILKEDASTNVKQFTRDDYINDRIPAWEAIEEE